MPMWRCPHCGTPQAEAARCWVCRRSSTSCGTCRHFRRAVAANLGYCGLDRARTPLAGDELRGCWQEGVPGASGAAGAAGGAPGRGDTAPIPAFAAAMPRRLEFVEVARAGSQASPASAATRPARRRATAATPATEATPAGVPSTEEPRWSLWGDPDR